MSSATTTTVAARVPNELAADLVTLAERLEAKRTDIITAALRQYIDGANATADALHGPGQVHSPAGPGEADGARGNRFGARVAVLDLFRRAGAEGLTSPEARDKLPDGFDSNTASKRVSELARLGFIAPLVTTVAGGDLTRPLFNGKVRAPLPTETWNFEVPGAVFGDEVTPYVDELPRHTSITRTTRHGKQALVYAITLAGSAALTEAKESER